ncbi:MAG TPA: hypothetical protein PKO33_10875 [Pyrinomonadaceae bacterium]|nr:hypothetical protein [Pyrinomonadaceae bacterium]
MNPLNYVFSRNFEKYEGVRPINIYFLRTLYLLMFTMIGYESWSTIFGHEGTWDHTKAVAWCVWAAYTTLSFFGILNPLRWLPIVVFMIFYKTLWLIVVALPLWRAGTLAGSPPDGMAHVYIAAPFIALIVPWGYFVKRFILGRERRSAT